MTVPRAHVEPIDASARYSILYVGEFPPSNHHGGAILLRRLLDRHPASRLAVIASDLGFRASRAHDLFKCRSIVVPSFRWSVLPASAAKALELAFVLASTLLAIKENRANALITIVQGRYYLAAALAAWFTRTPHVTIVHDNFLSASIGPSGVVRTLKRSLTKQTLQQADHIYTVSPEMQRLVWDECGVTSEIQLPSATAHPHRSEQPDAGFRRRSRLIIMFAGLISYTVKDCLDLLVEMIKSGALEGAGISGVQLHLCTPMTNTELQAFGWNHADIVCKGWVPQSELAAALAEADVLFLPYSFREASRASVEKAFPSKTADYLAAGKPLLVLGPAYSSLVRYASESGFAEIVDELSETALVRGIRNIACSANYREELAAKALQVFRSNHDIETQQRKFYLTLGQIQGSRRTSSRDRFTVAPRNRNDRQEPVRPSERSS